MKQVDVIVGGGLGPKSTLSVVTWSVPFSPLFWQPMQRYSLLIPTITFKCYMYVNPLQRGQDGCLCDSPLYDVGTMWCLYYIDLYLLDSLRLQSSLIPRFPRAFQCTCKKNVEGLMKLVMYGLRCCCISFPCCQLPTQ